MDDAVQVEYNKVAPPHVVVQPAGPWYPVEFRTPQESRNDNLKLLYDKQLYESLLEIAFNTGTNVERYSEEENSDVDILLRLPDRL